MMCVIWENLKVPWLKLVHERAQDRPASPHVQGWNHRVRRRRQYCTVKNLSDTGAALEVLSPLYVPDRFTLFVPTDQLKRRCHVVWQKQRRIGIAFD